MLATSIMLTSPIFYSMHRVAVYILSVYSCQQCIVLSIGYVPNLFIVILCYCVLDITNMHIVVSVVGMRLYTCNPCDQMPWS